jgi:hypothetical protein
MMTATMAMAGGYVRVVNVGGMRQIVCRVEGFVAERGGRRRHVARATQYARVPPRERLFQKSGHAIARANDARMR